MADIPVLNVLLENHVIGTLTLLDGDRTLFAFTEDYINDQNRPVLSLSFKDAFGELITDIPPTRARVPPFFSNLLPEGALRDYLAKRAGVKSVREFFLLWIVGRDLAGGVRVEPANRDALPDLKTIQEPEDRDFDGSDPQSLLRFSLAGVQLKFSAVVEAAGGLTIPAEGVGGSWIVKLPSFRHEGVPENEFSMMTLARLAGIEVPDVKLVPVTAIKGLPADVGKSGGEAFAIKRFDRTERDGLVHIEDFAQIFGIYPEKKYQRGNYRNIAEVIWTEIGETGITEYIRRLIFNALIGNGDMHLKNWSLIYPDGRRAALAPAYDFVSTIVYIENESLALNFGKSKRFTDLTVDTLVYFAGKARLPERLVLDTAFETVERFRDVWAGEKGDLPLSKAVIDTIQEHQSKILLRLP